MKKITLIFSMVLGSLAVQAQIITPQPSPASTVTQKIGLNEVSITYSRPSAKGRKVFGDLVPMDKLWRTGANRSTKLSVSDTVTINNVKVPKGDYSIFTVPGQREWMIIINKDANLGGTTGYDQNKDVTRFKVAPSVIPFVETFTINFSDVTEKSANVELTWETTRVVFKIESDADSKIMASIGNLGKISGQDYFLAARYYYDTNRDMKLALEWIDIAIANGMDKFWVLRQKSLIQAKLGDYKGAIATAEQSLALASKEGNDDYVKMNTESISEWKKK